MMRNLNNSCFLKVRARDDWMPFAHVAVAIDTCGHGSPDVYPLMLAKTVRPKRFLLHIYFSNILYYNSELLLCQSNIILLQIL